MIAASRQWLRRFSLWLSLAVVLTCALCSFGSPLRASAGSAFNAFTSDVALGPSRASAPEKNSAAQTLPRGGAGQAKLMAVASLLVPAPPLAASRVHGRTAALSVLPVVAGPLGARAPPLS